MIKLFRGGESFSFIGRHIGISPITVKGWLERAGEDVSSVTSSKICRACGQKFSLSSNRQLTCLTCTPDKGWRHRYRRYGITKPLYDQIMEEQDGSCPLCLESLKEDIDTCVDHCHNSLMIRGILCRGCNMALSRIEDGGFMQRARAYLELGGFDPIVSQKEA